MEEHHEEDPVGSKCRVWIFINIYFGNLETINLLLITVYPYVSTNECDAVARPIPLPIYYLHMQQYMLLD